MNNFDKIIYQYRYLIGAILIIVIISGAGLIVWQKIGTNKKTEKSQITALQQQNELLRSQLSGNTEAVAGVSTTAQSTGEKININTADLTALDKIPSVGPAIAQRIIDYRTQNGGFKSIDDIKNVKGIGDKTFEKMKDLITVGE
jgi:competence protein ComEA